MASIAQQAAAARRTTKYKALVAVINLDTPAAVDAAALKILGVELPVAEPEPDPNAEALAGLIAAGFDEAEAQEILTSVGTEEATALAAPAKVAPRPQSSKDQAEALVAESDLTFTKGRVYLTPDSIEAAVRVRRTGHPEIITSSGVGRTKAVVLFREDSGDVAAQNLAAKPEGE